MLSIQEQPPCYCYYYYFKSERSLVKSVNVQYVIVAYNSYKHTETPGPRVPAEQWCVSLSVTCKAFIGFIYLAASGRRIRFLLLSSC